MTDNRRSFARITQRILKPCARNTLVVLLMMLTVSWGIPTIARADEAVPAGDPISDVLDAVKDILDALKDAVALVDSAELDQLITATPQILAAGLPIPPADMEERIVPCLPDGSAGTH